MEVIMPEELSNEIKQNRKPEHEINKLILDRWSPRSMTADEISDEDLMALFEAAKWAPSSYNNQPWHFVYAKRGTLHWQKFLDLMVDFNKNWAKNASVLVVITSSKNFEYNKKPSKTHSFDTGAAWENLALEAVGRGFYAHAMEGFDYEKTRKAFEIPDDYEIECMVAIGKKEMLPKELQEMEVPSKRKLLKEIVMEGKFRR